MTADQALESLCRIRHLVAFLGSRKQFNWWDCSFMDETGLKFLETTFPRSARKAAFESTSEAALYVHDDALGRKGCFHLFRLPVHLEDRLSSDDVETGSLCAGDEALSALAEVADNAITAPPGPVQIGVARRILTETSIREIAAHYHSAFQQGIRSYPYFAAE